MKTEAKTTPARLFRPGEKWPDDRGAHINAHGGGVLFHEGVYYWFGEHKIAGEAGNTAQVGVHPANNLGPEKTWGGQSTFLLPVAGRPGLIIAMFDVWRPADAIDGRYIWLPAEFLPGGRMRIEWRDEWGL